MYATTTHNLLRYISISSPLYTKDLTRSSDKCLLALCQHSGFQFVLHLTNCSVVVVVWWSLDNS